VLGHVLDGTPAEYERGKIEMEVCLNGAMNKATGTDVKGTVETAHFKMEADANEVASMLCRMLWQE